VGFDGRAIGQFTGPPGGISRGRYGRGLLKVSWPVPAACTHGTNLAAKIRLS